jgi:tetratricopeptide (TPR) repeat protein
MTDIKIGRNNLCHCGSGKKYKHCCERKENNLPIPPSTELIQLNKLFNSGRHSEAETLARTLLEHFPNEGIVWKVLAMSLQMQNKEALIAFQKTAQLLPLEAGAHYNLGNALHNAKQLNAAVSSFINALKISGNFFHAHYGLGSVYLELGQPEKAVNSYRRALEINPNFVEAHYNLGHALLLLGQYSEGWREYEYRLKDSELEHIRAASKLPQWRGQRTSLSDQLLVFAEQGFGDTLQFGRYLTMAAERFPNGVSIVVDNPLHELFQNSFPQTEVLNNIPTDQRNWQWQCSLLSLPLAFNTKLETVPKQIPYLNANPARVAHWQARIALLELPADTLKVGIVWKPGTLMKNAKQRSLTVRNITPLLNHSSCAWFSLQKESDQDSAPWVTSGRLIDWSGEFSNFGETAALASNLDMVISVDTSVVHLAGGLGIPTWLFNQHTSEWRWMLSREDSPWYPTMRIFTQKNTGDWDEVVKRMVNSLNERLTVPIN